MFSRRIIVGGLPRSGSTLFRFMLDASSSILAGPETSFFIEPLSQHQMRPERSAPKIAEKLGVSERVIRDAILTSRTSFSAFDKMMQAFAATVGASKPGWAEKTPRNCFAYSFLAAEHPEACFISTIRHGLDVVTSEGHDRPKNPDEYWLSVQRYCDSMVAIYAFSHPRHLIVRYEELVTNPEPVLRDVMRFLGLPFEQAMIDEFGRETKSRDLNKVTQPKLREPLQASWIGRWNSPAHAERVREFLAHPEAVAWLERSGYSLDSSEPAVDAGAILTMPQAETSTDERPARRAA